MNKKFRNLFTIIILFTALFVIVPPISAQDNTEDAEISTNETPEQTQTDQEIKYKAKILEVTKETCPTELGQGECMFFDLEINSGDKKGETVSSTLPISNNQRIDNTNYKKGQEVYIVETQVGEETAYYVKEPIRKNSLLVLAVLFGMAVIAVGGLQGITSLLGLVASFTILRFIVISMLLSGSDPLTASIFGGSLILGVSVYLSHGFNKKTSIALIGTILSLILTGILAYIFTKSTQLTGYATDEATFLVQLLDVTINMRGIVLASLILGGIGVLDDVTVSQVATVFELYKANNQLPMKELFKRSMVIGRDHIASMVNTLVLAYTSSALPLILLFVASKASLEEIINYELISEEIVRTLVGSIGLILAVPITTFLAATIVTQNSNTHIPMRSRARS